MCSRAGERCSFFAEFLPRVGTYQIAFDTQDSCKLTVSARTVVCTELRDAESREIIRWPTHLPDLQPGSYLAPTKHSPRENKPLQLRFRCVGPTQPVLAKFEKLLDPPDLPPPLPAPSTTLILVKCGFCGQILTKRNYTFKRVLPLPSDEWSEIVSDSFCHLHTHAPSSSSSSSSLSPPHTSLTARPGDFLTGRRVVKVTGECLVTTALVTKHRVVHCSRCYLGLGQTQPTNLSNRGDKGVESGNHGDELAESKDIANEQMELERSEITLEFLPPPPSSPRSLSRPSFWSCVDKERHLALTLCSACREKSSFKFTIQDSLGHIYLHVWMLNVVSHVICNTRHMTSKFPTSNFTGITSSGCSDNFPALKLLYMVATETSPAPRSRDKPDPLPLSREECLWLRLALCQSNGSLPPSQRCGRNLWMVGYLHLD